MTRSTSPPSSGVLQVPVKPLGVYLLILYGITLFFLIRWPIVAGDTDLWYHLNGGRYILEHHAIPHTSFFSFVSPPRIWVDYYWLFQALIYTVYSWFWYDGLVVLRAGMYLATVTMIMVFLLKDQEGNRALAWCVTIAALCSVLLIPRIELVRPHLFSYFFSVVFLYVLECAPHRVGWLPVLAILWCNLHGITYPVMWLITGAYGAERLLSFLKGTKSRKAQVRSFLLPLALSMLAVFLTPHGAHLLKVPFRSLAYESHVIGEFTHLTLNDLLSGKISVLIPTFQTLVNLYLVLTGLSFLSGVTRKQVRVSHVLLCLGGTALLTKGIRFVYEFVILALPLLKANPLCAPDRLKRRAPTPIYLALEGLLMILPLTFVQSYFADRPRYPFSHRGLPQGIVAFLNRIDATGKILNYPNNGGYLQWALSPRYKIFMDMEVPFLFTTDDLRLVDRLFVEEEALRNVLAKYDPEFIVVPLAFRDFRDVIKKFPEYVVVFFDDVEVLYVNARRYPAIAQSYALKGIDPFALQDQNIDDVIADREGLVKYLPRLLEIHPECVTLGYIAGRLKIREKAYEQAIAYASTIMRSFPEYPMGYRLKGDALMELKRFSEARAYYQQGLERASGFHVRRLYEKIALTYLEQHQYAKAYGALREIVNVFSTKTSAEDLANLGLAALRAGRKREAQTVLQSIYTYKIAPDNTVWAEQFRNTLTRFGLSLDEVSQEDGFAFLRNTASPPPPTATKKKKSAR